MKPLTANDLKVGGKYVVKLPTHSEVCEYFGVNSGGYLFKKCPIAYLLNEKEISTLVTPYHEPNQTTMNTDYTEQPFNLETALKHPEWARTRDGREIDFIKEYPERYPIYCIVAVLKEGSIYLLNKRGKLGQLESDYDLILRVPYQTVYVSILPHGEAKWNTCDSGVDGQLYCVPVKIPAI